MKADITPDGGLVIFPESSTELFAIVQFLANKTVFDVDAEAVEERDGQQNVLRKGYLIRSLVAVKENALSQPPVKRPGLSVVKPIFGKEASNSDGSETSPHSPTDAT